MATDEELSRFRYVLVNLPRRLNVTAMNEGLSPTQASILGIIVGRGPVGLPDIIHLESIHPTMLSRVIRKLSSDGLIERKQHPEDLRSATVDVTDAGLAKHTRIKEARQKVVNESFERLDADHQAALIAALPALEALATDPSRIVRISP